MRVNLGLAGVAMILTTACQTKPKIDAAEAAKTVSDKVGTVQQVYGDGNKGPVFVFEEFHTSLPGQVQIATMLTRLHDRYGVATIGLEGSFQAPKPLDADYFHDAEGADKDARESVAVRMLSDGQVSSAEFMTLLFPDVRVFGLELASQYNQTSGEGDPVFRYLLAIAEKSITGEKAQEVNVLLKSASKQQSKAKKEELVSQAFDVMLNSDPWVKSQYDSLKAGTDNVRSTEAEAENLRQIKAKAAQVRAEIDSEVVSGMDQAIRFYETASERSDTMVNRVLNLPDTEKTVPVAMIIGAGHSDKVTQLLRQKKAAFALLRPVSLNPKGPASLTTAQYERKIAGNWLDDNALSLGRILNTHKKPPPMVELKSAASFSNVNFAAHVVATAARAGRPLPDDPLRKQLSKLPGVIVDFSSFQRDGYDVIFAASVTDNEGRSRKVWMRVGTAANASAAKSLEEKLLAENHRLGGDGSGMEPPGNGPTTGSLESDDPDGGRGGRDGRGNRGGRDGGGGHDGRGPVDAEGRDRDVGVSHAGMDTLVVFSENREKVASHERLSY